MKLDILIKDVNAPKSFRNSAQDVSNIARAITLALNGLSIEIPQGAFEVTVKGA